MAPVHVTISGKQLMSHPVEASSICPHCWHEFYGDQALYISEHPGMFGDPVLGDVPVRLGPEDVTCDEDGRVFDPQGWPVRARERACPRCHLPIPPELLSQRPRVVSIVGVPGSDRSCLTPMMLYQLRTTLASQFRGALEKLDRHTQEFLAENLNRLFGLPEPARPINLKTGPETDSHVLLDGISMLLPKPLLLAAQGASEGPSQSTRSGQQCLALYENAGESFLAGGDHNTTRSTQHLQESDAVLFAYDPLLEPETRRRLHPDSHNPQASPPAPTSHQCDLLATVIDYVRRGSEGRGRASGQRLSTSLAVCVQSYDVWRSLVDHLRDDSGESVIESASVVSPEEHGTAAVDTTKINIVSWIVRCLLLDISPEVVMTAEAQFDIVRYFPVSALGHRPPLSGDQLSIKPTDVRPFGVDHAMLWLLNRWEVIPGTAPEPDNPRQLPVARVRHASEREVRVVCPETSQLFRLDKDYAGREFYNPDAGKYFWIPRV